MRDRRPVRGDARTFTVRTAPRPSRPAIRRSPRRAGRERPPHPARPCAEARRARTRRDGSVGPEEHSAHGGSSNRSHDAYSVSPRGASNRQPAGDPRRRPSRTEAPAVPMRRRRSRSWRLPWCRTLFAVWDPGSVRVRSRTPARRGSPRRDPASSRPRRSRTRTVLEAARERRGRKVLDRRRDDKGGVDLVGQRSPGESGGGGRCRRSSTSSTAARSSLTSRAARC